MEAYLQHLTGVVVVVRIYSRLARTSYRHAWYIFYFALYIRSNFFNCVCMYGWHCVVCAVHVVYAALCALQHAGHTPVCCVRCYILYSLPACVYVVEPIGVLCCCMFHVL